MPSSGRATWRCCRSCRSRRAAMRVILLNDLRAKGKRGQEVDVKPGFARNYLLPQGHALEATDANRKWFQSQRKKIDARVAEEREAALQAAGALTGARVEIH